EAVPSPSVCAGVSYSTISLFYKRAYRSDRGQRENRSPAQVLPQSLRERMLCGQEKHAQWCGPHQISQKCLPIGQTSERPGPRTLARNSKRVCQHPSVVDLQISSCHSNHRSQSKTNHVAREHPLLLPLCNKPTAVPSPYRSKKLCSYPSAP